LDTIIAGGLKFDASDIHFEPYEDKVIVRYRLDGLLYDVISLDKENYEIIKNRIKIISGMMLNITDKPQDGSFSVNFEKNKIDFRVSSLPTGYGEAFVIRILNFSKITKSLEDLGLREDDYEILNKIIFLPNGMILNTGPTGSGKTTTLYSILMKLKRPEVKIITIENPIEYRIEGITQVEIDEKKNLTFASALKAFLRHDPDVILVGEIRDKETANTAIQASLTGHLVLSTLHTNSSLGAIPRLISLEVDPKLIPSALRLVIAQRLVRKICENCKEEYEPDEKTKEKIKKELQNLPSRVNKDFDLDNFKLAKGLGCNLCFNTGYKGRIGIFELFVLEEKLQPLILKNPTEEEIYLEIKDNFVSMKQDGLIKALRKVTTLEEVERVTGIL
jgi:type II secretory ATPase GspE/PulE/Tfp pilus assembly ATPase PilB-like protein